MHYFKKIVGGLFLILIAVGFFYVYKKDRARIITEQEKIKTEQATEQKVAGAEKTAGGDTTYLFTEEEALNRLKITPGNIVWYSNYYRSKQGLAPLIQRKALNNSAQAKNFSMIQYQYFEHTQPGTTVSFDKFIDEQKYEFLKIGENLAMGDFSTSKEVVDAWMKSPDHKRNIMDTVYTEIGVNVKTGTYQGRQVVFITQHFGKPRKSCPTIDSSLKTIVADLSKQVTDIGNLISEGKGDYNTLAATYNDTVARMNALAEKYNNQIRAFNACANASK
jgi:hypothetical protein